MKTEKFPVDLKPDDQNIEVEMSSSDVIINDIQHSTSSQFFDDLKNTDVPLNRDINLLKRIDKNLQNQQIASNPLRTADSSNFTAVSETTATKTQELPRIRPENRLDKDVSSAQHFNVADLQCKLHSPTASQPHNVDKLSASFVSSHAEYRKSEDNEESFLLVQSKSPLTTNKSSTGTAHIVDYCSKEGSDIVPGKVASSRTNCCTASTSALIGCNKEDSEKEDDWPDFPHSPPSPSYASPPSTSKGGASFITKETNSMESSTCFLTKTTVPSSPSIWKGVINTNIPHVDSNDCVLPLPLPYDNSRVYDVGPDGGKPSCSFLAPLSDASKNSFMDVMAPNRISVSSSHPNHTEQDDERHPASLQYKAFKSATSHVQNLVLVGSEAFKSATSHVQNLVLVGSEGNPQPSGWSACVVKRNDDNSNANGNMFVVEAISSNDKTPCYRPFTDSISASWSQENGSISRQVRALLAEGVDPRRRDERGSTPAHVAAKKGCTATLAALLYLGADANAKDVIGWTPLHNASRYNQSECVELLVARGAHVEARNADGKSPLHVAVAACAREATRALLAAGANNRSRDENGATPLDVAQSVAVRRSRLVGRLSGRFLSIKGFGHWIAWRQLLEKERKIRAMLNHVHRVW